MTKKYPYYMFHKTPIEYGGDIDINNQVIRIKHTTSQEEALKLAYNIVTKKFQGGRINTILKLNQLFSNGVNDLWKRKGFMHCTNQNYILTYLLVQSGMFQDDDITCVWTNTYLSPHQYLKISLSNGNITNVDCWARCYNVQFGEHASWFNTMPNKFFVE